MSPRVRRVVQHRPRLERRPPVVQAAAHRQGACKCPVVRLIAKQAKFAALALVVRSASLGHKTALGFHSNAMDKPTVRLARFAVRRLPASVVAPSANRRVPAPLRFKCAKPMQNARMANRVLPFHVRPFRIRRPAVRQAKTCSTAACLTLTVLADAKHTQRSLLASSSNRFRLRSPATSYRSVVRSLRLRA